MALVEGPGEGFPLLNGCGMAESAPDARTLKSEENGPAPLSVGGIPLKSIEGLVFAKDRSCQGSAGEKAELHLPRKGGMDGDGRGNDNGDLSLEGGGQVGSACINSEVVVAPLVNGEVRESPAVDDDSQVEDAWVESVIQCLDEKVCACIEGLRRY